VEPERIVDRGLLRPPGVSRYGLEVKLMQEVERVASELQHFLQRAAALVPGRQRFFHIDPENAVLPLLGNSSSILQLKAAWEIMRKRLGLGRSFVHKYAKELDHPDPVHDFSPIPT
ncbi:hypothetical protein R3P38DRAFT_2356947, partial [Favolaschia claudopus]